MKFSSRYDIVLAGRIVRVEAKIEQIRGKTPMQFTLTFRWNSSASGT